jgi:cell division protein FtsL
MVTPQSRAPNGSSIERPVRRRPEGWSTSKRAPGWTWPRGARLGRAIVVLVAPVLLMLGSVYVHTVASELKGDTVRLEDEKASAEGEGERLEVRITELSDPGRVRSLAKNDLSMRDAGKDLETYSSEGEDVTDGGGKSKGAEK